MMPQIVAYLATVEAIRFLSCWHGRRTDRAKFRTLAGRGNEAYQTTKHSSSGTLRHSFDKASDDGPSTSSCFFVWASPCASSSPSCAARFDSLSSPFSAMGLLAKISIACHVWPQAPRQRPFAVSLILQAYKNNSHATLEMDWLKPPLAFARGSKPAHPSTR